MDMDIININEDGTTVEKFVYYWPKLDIYCYASELDEYKLVHGHNYSVHVASEFFLTTWIDKERL